MIACERPLGFQAKLEHACHRHVRNMQGSEAAPLEALLVGFGAKAIIRRFPPGALRVNPEHSLGVPHAGSRSAIGKRTGKAVFRSRCTVCG